MSRRPILIPLGDFEKQDAELKWSLILADPEEPLSSREQQWIDKWFAHGELWPGYRQPVENGFAIGAEIEGTGQEVIVRFPEWVSLKRALQLFGELFEAVGE